MFDNTLDAQEAAKLIRTLLKGGSPNGAAPEAFGKYRDIVEVLLRAYAAGDTDMVREAWDRMVRRQPKLAALVSADQDHPGQKSGRDTSADEPEQPTPGATRKQRQPTQTQQLLALATKGTHEDDNDQGERAEEVVAPQFFHSPDHDAFVTFSVNGHMETWPCKSKAFRRWLAYQFFRQNGRAPRGQAVQEVLQTIEGLALFDGPELPVFARMAAHNGAIYLDLANEGWEAVEITALRWRVVASPPVKFRRARGMLPLPRPESGRGIDALRPFVNIADDDAWRLLAAWLVGTLSPKGPYPVLVLHGEQGSAKSTTARLLRALVDPNSVPLRVEPRNPRDMMIAATNAWILSYDNLSHLPAWLSDAICRLATGGGFGTRELFTDNEEALFDAMRPVILTGIEELATRGDLLDRAIILYLPAIPENQRRREADLWREFEALRPYLLGALLDVVSAASRRMATVQVDKLPRMADFALWLIAAESALGWQPGAFMQAYTGNRVEANELTLEASLIAPLIRELAHAGFTGTATDLLQRLNDRTPEKQKQQKGWPANARALSNALRRITPNLRAIGVEVEFLGHRGQQRQRLITIRRRNP
jgi:hypothetical protein